MAVALAALSNVTYGSRTNTTVTAAPLAPISNGDLLVLVMVTGASPEAPDPTPPAGFSLIPGTWPVEQSDIAPFNLELRIYSKVASGESGDYTVTHTVGSTAAAIMRITGADATTPFVPAATAVTDPGTSQAGTTGTTWTGLTTARDGSLVVAIDINWGNTANNLVVPSGTTPTFTENLDTTIMWIGSGVMTTAGATGNKSHATNSSTGPWMAYLLAIQPAVSSQIVTQFLTGFEHGFVGSAATVGGGLIDSLNGTWTAGGSARNGSFCAHFVSTASAARSLSKNVAGGATKVVARLGIKVSVRPTSGDGTIVFANQTVSGTSFDIQVSSAGVLAARCGAGSFVTGPTIDTTSWHLLELQFDGVAGTLDWKVDGVLQTRATGASAGLASMLLGTRSATQTTFTCDYDDWIFGTWTNAATDWYGDGKVLAQLPASDGTHATIASLSPGDAGTAYSGTVTTAWTMVDDAAGTSGWTATRSTTDNLALRIATVGAYAEIAPAATAELGQANAVRAIMSYSSSTTSANLAACDARNSAGAVTELWGLTGGVGKAYNVTANNFGGGIVTRPAAGWTAAEVNAVRFRFGGCTSADISPVPTVQAMMLEVDWPIAPVVRAKPVVMRQAVNRAAVM